MRVPARERRWRALAFLAVPGALLVTTVAHASPPSPVPPAPGRAAAALTLDETLQATTRATGSKAPTSRLAETDPALLGRTDDTPVAVMIKLDYDSVATYSGTIDGLDATSPSVTGRELTATSSAERRYDQYIATQEAAFTNDLARTVPAARVGRSIRTVYGGVTAVVPANRIADILAIANVVAVQEDRLVQPDTDASREFIGATTLYPRLGGESNAGRGVIVGILDTGAWPEHPAFAAPADMPVPPAKPDRSPRSCDFGDNPLTTAVDPFACNRKLISGEAFLETYTQVNGAPTYTTARDSEGHGTHTATTAAGNVLSSAPVLGVDRGPLGGVAPGAFVAVYKVCGTAGCYQSDSAEAVEQAIFDGVKVINFSIGGGEQPSTDPVELAFLDAYAAGVFVAASAGNDGPGESTAGHVSPWVTTVAASTESREFVSTLTVTGDDGSTATFVGASITRGVEEPTPVVIPAADPLCQDTDPEPGVYEGVIVACERGVNARVEKGVNVLEGGAVGMILYNPTLADIETDSHWLPTVHLADGTDFLAFMDDHTGVTATFTAGEKQEGMGDVMAGFSSRGPAGVVIKPDITAPGVQTLAGWTPMPEAVTDGPPGEYFAAIAGTSMASPHIAGSAVLLKALHPSWTPGQIKSALMTTSVTDVVKEDLVTPADPFDMGAGRVDLTVAGNPGLTFDAAASDMWSLGFDEQTAVNLNVPSINVPVLPGRVVTTRTATNVTGTRVRYDVEASAPDGSSITVSPSRLNLGAGASGALEITIASDGSTEGQQFGEVRLVPQTAGLPELHLPVAFIPQQGTVTLTSACADDEIARGLTTTCTVTARNLGFEDTEVDLTTSVNRNLRITAAEGASLTRGMAALLDQPLTGSVPGSPELQAEPDGFIGLAGFGVQPEAIGDEEVLTYSTPPFLYAGVTYTSFGIDSNGYLVVGPAAAQDNNCCNPAIPNAARPNNVLAPYWTDLDGSDAAGIRTAVLAGGGLRWLVVEWEVNVFGTDDLRHFQVWLGLNDQEDITFNYDPHAAVTVPAGEDVLVVGAENIDGSDGDSLGIDVAPATDLRVVSSDPTPGGSVSYRVTVRGERVGEGLVTTEMDSPSILGTTVVSTPITVVRR